jgi:SAM-dependent methyltransferase
MNQQMPSDSLIRRMRRQMGSIPVLGPGLKSLRGQSGPPEEFRSSPTYWERRYCEGGNSGVGSYGRLAHFKAAILNDFVAKHGIASVVEFGCGDGAQLALADYPDYLGLDVSLQAVEICRQRFGGDPAKRFQDLQSVTGGSVKAELSLSLDVIYHLVEDGIYQTYMHNLADAATRFVGVYSSNVALPGHVPHIRHRCFTDWFASNAPEWTPIGTILNAFPHDPANPDETSWADFHFFERAQA